MKFILSILMASIAIIGCNKEKTNNSEAQVLEPKKIRNNAEDFLKNWREDSLGCQGVRIKLLEKGFFDTINIDDQVRSNVIKMLGTPNRIRYTRGVSVKDEYIDKDIIVLMYFTSSICSKEDELNPVDPISWINITILKETDRVVQIMGGVT